MPQVARSLTNLPRAKLLSKEMAPNDVLYDKCSAQHKPRMSLRHMYTGAFLKAAHAIEWSTESFGQPVPLDVQDPASLNVAKFQKVGTFLEVVVGTLVTVGAVRCAVRLAVGLLPIQLGSALVQLHQRLPGIVRRSAWPAHATECNGRPETQAGIKAWILETSIVSCCFHLFSIDWLQPWPGLSCESWPGCSFACATAWCQPIAWTTT